MSFVKGREKLIVQLQPPQRTTTPISVDQRLLLIRNIRKYPRLYKNEFLRTPFLYRIEKHQMWDKIAEDSGFEKTEDAKCKWRSLIIYLRTHLDNVAQKKRRRYIPISDNPDDKYLKLTDWPFYKELEFVVPYVKYAASKQFSNTGNHLEISPSEIDIILEGIEAEIEKRNEGKEAQVAEHDVTQNPQQNEDVPETENNNEQNLTADDEILKEYFENMLKSTLKLPRFYQNLIRQTLQDCINEQKALNKIN